MWKLKYVSGQFGFNSLHNFFSLSIESNKDKKNEAMKMAEERSIELRKEAVETYGNPDYFSEFQLVWMEETKEKEIFQVNLGGKNVF